jgi:hypothetical protein
MSCNFAQDLDNAVTNSLSVLTTLSLLSDFKSFEMVNHRESGFGQFCKGETCGGVDGSKGIKVALGISPLSLKL